MQELRRYRRRTNTPITAVQFNIDIDGFNYKKWGGEQRCKRGDWLVDNDGDIYTIDDEVFNRTYRKITPGRYVKSSPVWARIALESGTIKTKEGSSDYRPGDYLVYNSPDGIDGYCMSAKKFDSIYEADE
jgi:hypothetical protein